MAKPRTKVKKKASKRAKRAAPGRAPADPRARALARALSDPCNAPLEPGCYPGQVGFVSRFSQTFTISLGASDTAFMLAVSPGAAISALALAATPTTTITPSFLNTFVPGGTYLVNNAKASRCLGGCIEFFTNQNALNALGTYQYGVGPHSTIANGAISVGAIGSAMQFMNKINADAYEIKWRPGALDEQYSRVNVNVSDDMWDDVNAMILCGIGLPVSTTITAKVTLILEWLPVNNIGLAMPAACNPSNVKPSAVVAAMDAHSPGWWAGKVGHAANFVWNNGGKQLASFASNAAAGGLARLAMKAVPLLL